MLKGEQNILWPSEIKWFAKSSGTTSDRSKFIPVSEESLQECHFKGGKDMLSIFCNNRPDNQILTGKGLVLGGSHQINQLNEDSFYGDLSAVLIKNLPVWAEYYRTPNISIALMDNYEEKMEKMAEATIKENVTNIAGVPTWTIVLAKKVLEMTGKNICWKYGQTWNFISMEQLILSLTESSLRNSSHVMICITWKPIMHQRAFLAYRMRLTPMRCY